MSRREALLDLALDERRRPKHPTSVQTNLSQLNAFDAVALQTPTRDLLGMVRGDSPWTSQVAAVKALGGRTKLQVRILAHIAAHGPATALEIESHPAFADVKPYGCRRRCTDLVKMVPPQLVRIGRRGDAGLLDIAPTEAK